MGDTGAPEAIGGWLRAADASFDRRHRRLDDIDAAALDPAHLAYFEDYRRRYFNDRLVPGQGVENILDALTTHGGQPARWADLGAGVTTLFWAIGVNSPGQVVACDLVPEALTVLSTFRTGSEVPPCYEEAMALVGRSRAAFEATRRGPWSFHVFDALAPWRLPNDADGFDLVTAMGCFGLSRDAAQYADAFAAAAAHVRPGGRFVGADWHRSPSFIAAEGHDNRYVSEALTTACARAAGLTPLSIRPVPIEGDPHYASVLVWAFEKPVGSP